MTMPPTPLLRTVVAAPTMFTSSGTEPETLVPSARALRLSYFALHEWLGLVWYRLGYLVSAAF